MTARRWIAVLTAGTAGLLTAVASWDTAPAAAYSTSSAGPARRGQGPHAAPSPSLSPATTAGGGETVVIAPSAPSPSPATTAGGGDNVVIASPAPSPSPTNTPSPSPSPTNSPSPANTAGGGDTVIIAPENDGANQNAQNNDRFFRRRRPFRENPHLEFTGWIGWPELAMGCHFDPYFEGVDWNGRRVVCVDRAVRPPSVGLPRVRGRRFFFPRRRFPFRRFS
ncbi:hypothetical protein [Actinoallomurus rhizosphaericola]|uniref:hypothetical protein n=1 Tax=Actinoallomurus rhizosphaericola TaxID=2952536 RepID=UPI002093261D|nr:hypothetical protein [Actinoallomurus rhizosphaericola]MCO5996628.1 hypothetical protein [Actinoallomurus rhizosphaericola]